jgi:hypothetical protein
MLVWWFAYHSRLSTSEGTFRAHELQNMLDAGGQHGRPRWIALLVARLTARQNQITPRARILR